MLRKPRESKAEREARWGVMAQEKWDALKAALQAAHKEGCTSSKWTKQLVMHVSLANQPHISVHKYTCVECKAEVTG